MEESIKNTSRRDFIKTTSLISAGLLSFNVAEAKNPILIKNRLPEKLTILFQGDSITDAGRDRDREAPNDARAMGTGYALNIVSQLTGNNPKVDWTCYNRGISGNKVYQLADRWEEDCIQLKPDVLSVLIGVNDFWHLLNGAYDGTVDTYDKDLRSLLDRTLKKFPEVKLVIGEPFAVKGGSAISEKWYPAFYDYQKAAAQIAKDYNANWIPYQKVFDKALKVAPVDYWCPDGVHPSIAGNFLMAKAWLEGFESAFS